MIGNPEPLSEDSWVQVETLIPMPANERPSFAMTNGHTPFKTLFTNLLEGYKEVWSQSAPLSDEDIKWIQAL